MMRAIDLAMNQLWVMDEGALRGLLRIANRENEGPEAVAAKMGAPLENSQRVTVRDGVAIVPVTGPMFRRANMFKAISGATSIDLLARDFQTAIDDPAVKAILLDVDSPGGEVNGTGEFAQMIFAARDRKPITAYVSHAAASAAYWIASAADRIVATETALLGSIGVRAAYLDDRERLEKAGVREIEFVSSQSPGKRLDHDSDEGRARIQSRVDGLAAIFIGHVAKNRGVAEQTVLDNFGQGEVFLAADAIAAGMADELGDFESVLAGLSGRIPGVVAGRPAHSGGRTITGKDNAMSEDDKAGDEAVTANAPVITATYVAENHKDVADHFRAEGREVGAKDERERILGIEAHAMKGHHELVATLKADGTTSPDRAAAMILAAEKETGSRLLAGLREEDESQDMPDVERASDSDDQIFDTAAGEISEDQLRQAWDSKADVRAEFGNFEQFQAFYQADSEGRVRIFGRKQAA